LCIIGSLCEAIVEICIALGRQDRVGTWQGMVTYLGVIYRVTSFLVWRAWAGTWFLVRAAMTVVAAMPAVLRTHFSRRCSTPDLGL
jgi:hypothetical protein